MKKLIFMLNIFLYSLCLTNAQSSSHEEEQQKKLSNFLTPIKTSNKVVLSQRVHFKKEARSNLDGGYDSGYSKSENFWGRDPATNVKKLPDYFGRSLQGADVLDVGCGEGKNASFIRKQGANVLGIDVSQVALNKARNMWDNSNEIEWLCVDGRDINLDKNAFDIIISTGAFHCFRTAGEIQEVVRTLIQATKPLGIHVISSFNEGKQDLSGHPSTFHPFLPGHEFLLNLYKGHKIISETNETQDDIHPDNHIKHSHSLSRLVVQIMPQH